MRLILLILFAVVMGYTSSATSSTLIIQSHRITEHYSDTLVRGLRDNIKGPLQVIYVRDFAQDVNRQSEELTATLIAKKADSYTNLILLGYEKGYFDLSDKNNVYVTLFSDTNNTEHYGPALRKELALFDLSLSLTSLYNSTIYLVNDSTSLSEYRYGKFSQEIRETYRHIKIYPILVRDLTGLRKEIRNLNKLDVPKSLIINNSFQLFDTATQRYVGAGTIDLLISSLNKRHATVGVYKVDINPLLLHIGYTQEDIVSAIVENNTDSLSPILQINLESLQSDKTYHLYNLFLQNLNKINYLGGQK